MENARVALRMVRAIKAVKELEEIMRDGSVDEGKLVRLLKRLGLKKEQVDKIIEAKRVYDETGDEAEVIKRVAEAFGIPEEVLESAVSAASILDLLM